jgi:hypothetical protein
MQTQVTLLPDLMWISLPGAQGYRGFTFVELLQVMRLLQHMSLTIVCLMCFPAAAHDLGNQVNHQVREWCQQKHTSTRLLQYLV